MLFVWAGNREEKNITLNFTYTAKGGEKFLDVCGADFYRVLLDGKFASYGPTRTAAGYAIKRRIPVQGVRTVTVQVQGYNVPCYSCDRQSPFFGAEILGDDGVIADTLAFECRRDALRRRDVPRYGYQRGFTEVYDLTACASAAQHVYEVSPPRILGYADDCARYGKVTPKLSGKCAFRGFSQVRDVFWKTNPLYAVECGAFDVERDFLDKVGDGTWAADDYVFEREVTGFIGLGVTAEKECEIFVCFEEILPDGKWIFRRSTCNDFVCVKVPAGKSEFTSAEPYAFKHIKIIYKGNAQIKPCAVLLQNDGADCVRLVGNEKIVRIFEAAKATFRQNSVDIFTDCPGRERAGWLCDSYFTAATERLLCGDSKAERRFLENFLLAETKEIVADMLPDCFPAEHPDGCFIPNWAMWFVLELYEYFAATGDGELVARAKDKVDGLLRYFERYENEYGLLENLDGWVFVEWSVCNSPEYVRGVNFPTNMLYARMLERASELYGYGGAAQKAERIKAQILRLSFDGNFFADNAVREGGKLRRCDGHVSETCQYYALFTAVASDCRFIRKMAEKFGPLRGDEYPEIGRSNMFIGNYLRFFWLNSIGESERVLRECVDYFGGMAEKTGTLWEKDSPDASCNHGFASVAAVIILQALIGYRGVLYGKLLYDENAAGNGKKYGVTVIADYGKGKTVAKC